MRGIFPDSSSFSSSFLSETELLIAHSFSYKIKSYIRVLKEIWVLLSVDEGMRDTDSNFKAYKFDVYELNVKVFLI
ncbi:hypothetical protein CN338_06690 [Bacillus cereus]|nr:hypothetical protein CN338_06690 [Bacillus cereus]